MLLAGNSKKNRFSQRKILEAMLVVCLILAAISIPSQVQAQAKVGTTGAQFLELGVSSRAMGMAEAFTAVVDDISAVYYNPAGLVLLNGKEAGFTKVQMPADVNYYFAGIGLPLESVGGVVGVGFYGLFSGEIIERDYNRLETGRTFDYRAYALSVSYGRYLTDRFSVGVSVKYIGEYAHEYRSSGWSADVGTNYDTGFRGFRIAMSITNFGPDMTFIQNSYPLPINFKFGGTINVIENEDHVVAFAAEGSHPSDNLEKYNAGLEYTYAEIFTLRGGSRFNYDVDGFTAGGGLKFPFGEESEIRLDYAYQDYSVLTEVHRFTMTIAF